MMLKVNLISAGRCRVLHENSGAVIHTDSPPEYGGEGTSFAATDLVAAALGVCIATNLDKIAERGGVPLDAIEIRVEKTLSQKPKRIARLTVEIFIKTPISGALRQRFEKAARRCAVHRSLHPEIKVEIKLAAPAGQTSF